MSRTRSTGHWIVWSLLLSPALLMQQTQAIAPSSPSPNVVISQVYGGGGNSGAFWKNDFIELYNRGASPVTVTGWSVQYASSTGTSWAKTDLVGIISPGQYYLVQEAAGANAAAANLPGNCNQVRINAATALMNWLLTDPTGTSDPDILLIGDYNSYALEDPITVIRNSGFTDLVASFLGPDAYSYAFDGQWGYLDHALGSSTKT